MKSYIIAKERQSGKLKVLSSSFYLSDSNAVFAYELIDSADLEDDAVKIREHIESIGGVQNYLKEITEKGKKEQSVTVKALAENKKSFHGKLKECLDAAIIEKFQSQLALFDDYLDLIRHFLIENDALNYIRLNAEIRDEYTMYFRDVERQVEALKIGLTKLYYHSFHACSFDKFSEEMDKVYETEQLIVTCPLYKLKQALYKEEDARDIFAKYSDNQLRYAIENYDKSKYQQMRREWQAENDIKQTYFL